MAGATTLARTNVISSSNSDALVNFAGNTEVFCTVPGAKISLPKSRRIWFFISAKNNYS